jgi:hypothetical protein
VKRNRSWVILGSFGMTLIFVGLGLMVLEPNQEQEALAIMGADLLAARDQAAPCLIAIEHSPTPDRFAAALRNCIEAKYKGSYALQIEIELPEEGPRLKKLLGAESSLSAAVVESCVDTLISRFRPSPLGQAGWQGKMYEAYIVELARDGGGVTRAWKGSACGFPHPPFSDRQPMTPLNAPNSALLECDAQAAVELSTARPFVFGLNIRNPASADDAGQCDPIGNWLPESYSSCVCKALLDARRPAAGAQAVGTATLQVKTPDGQTVVVAQANTPSPPELTRRWFLRQSEPSDEPYLSMVTMSEPDIPVVWP